MKKLLKNRLFLVILTFIISISTCAVAANITARDISYKGMTVEEALDNLYKNGGSGGSGNSSIITSLATDITVEGVQATAVVIPTATDTNKIITYHYFMVEKENSENVRHIVSKDSVVKFTGLNAYTNYSYYCVAYDINNNYISSQPKDVTTKDVVISFKNKFDKYIYIDSNTGDDTTGDGTSSNPYKTLAKIATAGIIQNDYTYGIILNSGTYDLTSSIFTLTNNKSINIIGNREKTILNVEELFANKGGGSTQYDVNLYRLIWHGTSNAYNTINLKTKMDLYNVVFNLDYKNHEYSYFSSNNEYEFYNCTLPDNTSKLLRTTGGTLKLTNCYGGFSSGYGTNENSWNYQTNTITKTPQVDGSTYRITDSDETWKNNGTGLNPDNSQANRGVYGGTYSWDVKDDIF